MGRGGPDVLHTPRLVLRPWSPDDADALVGAIGVYDVARWLGRVPYPYGTQDARAFIDAAARRAGRDWLIERDGGIAGGISVDGELGFWLSRHAWGRGVATEACDAVVDAHFARRSASALVAGHVAGNHRSAQVLERQGFTYSGAVRHVRSEALSQTLTSRLMTLDRTRWLDRRRFRVRTDRLTLREVRDTDLSAILRLGRHADIATVIAPGAGPLTPAQARRWLTQGRFRGRMGFHAAICRWHRVIGTVGLTQATDTDHPTCTVCIDPAMRGRGLATEARRALLDDCARRFAVPCVGAPESACAHAP